MAREAEPGDPPAGLVRRGDTVLRPVPVAEFPVADPIHVYVEAYGLGLEGGRSSYEVTVVLKPQPAGGVAGALRRLFGEDGDPGVSVGFEAEGNAATAGDYVFIDASDQRPGEYTFAVRVRDLITGQEAVTARTIVLQEYLGPRLTGVGPQNGRHGKAAGRRPAPTS